MGRLRQYADNAAKQRAYRARKGQALRNTDVTLRNGRVFTPEVGQVYCMDALDFLRAIPSESVDLVVTSPPYNFRNSTGNGFKYASKGMAWTNNAFINGYDSYSDDMPVEQYIAWQRACLVECMRVLSVAGAIFYNHSWRVQGGLLSRVADKITEGFPVRQIIIWDRGAGFNFNPGYFVPSYEVLYLICKPGFTLVDKANALMNVWRITPSENKQHPNAFPKELARRCIISTSAQTVIDPFTGIGTTLRVAQEERRRFMGCDISPKYVDVARRDLEQPHTVPMFA